MYGINITKWASTTKHYYARVYYTSDINIIDRIRTGYLNIMEDMESMERVMPDVKAETEQDVMKKTKEEVDKYMGRKETIWVVCHEGKYSNSRTIHINK